MSRRRWRRWRGCICGSGFFEADMGVSGVNFAVAEDGVGGYLHPMRGNGRMCTRAGRLRPCGGSVGMEKIIPLFCGPCRVSQTAGPLPPPHSPLRSTRIHHHGTAPPRRACMDRWSFIWSFWIMAGRASSLCGSIADTLRCIRCGACLNACPIYRTVGGHAYGSVYPGPIGALLTPLFNGLELHEHGCRRRQVFAGRALRRARSKFRFPICLSR